MGRRRGEEKLFLTSGGKEARLEIRKERANRKVHRRKGEAVRNGLPQKRRKEKKGVALIEEGKRRNHR